MELSTSFNLKTFATPDLGRQSFSGTTSRTKQYAMTILIVADNIGFGGKERRMLELVKSLSSDSDNKVILLSISGEIGVGYDYVYDFPITIVETDRDWKYSIKPYTVIKKAIEKYKPDIVHSWGSMCSFYILPLLPFRKFKFINGTIADAPLHLPWHHKNYARGKLTYLFSDVVLSNSLAGIKSYGAPINKTYCIYNGIDMNRFKNLPNPQELKNKLGIEKFSFVAGMAGAFMDRKDYFTLTQAAIKIIEKHKDVCFLYIGEGHLRSEIEAIIPDFAKDNIKFLGRRPDVEALVQTFDIGILSTNMDVHGEGVSNSIIEYMSLYKPTVATEGGGTNEVVEDGVNGFLVKNKDVDGMVEKILYFYNNPDKVKQMGENAYQTIQKKFLLDRMTEEFMAVYRGEALSNRLYK